MGLLDDDCIRATIAARGGAEREWPGWRALVDREGEGYNRALGRYGVGKDQSLFGDVARLMRKRDLRVPELDAVWDAIRRELTGLS